MIVGNTIHTSNPHVLDMLFYPKQNPVVDTYIYNQVANVSSTLDEVGQKFMQANREIYDRVNNSELIRQARAVLRTTPGLSSPNTIYYYSSLDMMQHATPYMQNYIMANPTIRELYNDQLCNGYGEVYTDIDPGTIYDKQYHYRRVVDEVILVTEDGWKCTNYEEDLIEGDTELDIYNKSDILSTWEIMDIFIKAGCDPTDPDGGTL